MLEGGSALRSAVPAVYCGDAGAVMSMSSSVGWKLLQVPPEDNSLRLLAKKWHTELPQ